MCKAWATRAARPAPRSQYRYKPPQTCLGSRRKGLIGLADSRAAAPRSGGPARRAMMPRRCGDDLTLATLPDAMMRTIRMLGGPPRRRLTHAICLDTLRRHVCRGHLGDALARNFHRRVAPERAGIATYTYRLAVCRLRRHADRPVRSERLATTIPSIRTVNGASAEPRGGPGWAVSVESVASRLGDRYVYTACGSPSHGAVTGGPMGKRGAPPNPELRT